VKAAPTFDHGPRLARREYEQAIVDLYRDSETPADGHDEERIKRLELDLNIDFRLGTKFPTHRREALWRTQQLIEKRHARLAASWAASVLMRHLLHKHANRVARFVVDQYAKVLTEDELEAYFGVDERQRPSLPMDDA
jgi:hypothetical protein